MANGMFPKLYEKTEVHNSDQLKIFLDELVKVIESFDCQHLLSSHIGQKQLDQKTLISMFQDKLHSELCSRLGTISWKKEYQPDEIRRDAIDIFGRASNFSVIIELDKPRADQVAKKFVGRMALFPNTPVIYISLCYPGTKAMNSSECKKYFGYCNVLSQKMNNFYAGFIVEK